MARLGDVCTIVSGTTPKSSCPEYWDGDINWVTPAELNNESDVIYESQRKITKQAVIDSSLKPFPAGTVLLSSRAPIGKVAIAGTEMYCNQGFKNLICSDLVYNRYLYHFLKSQTKYLNSLGRGATFKEISKSIVEEIEIPLPCLEKQHRIAALLDKVSDLIAKRRAQLDKLDLLVKARFVEMFGDQEINTKGWYQSTVGECCTLKSGTSLPADKENEGGSVPYIKVGDMNYPGNEYYITTSSRYVSRTTAGSGVFPVGTVIFPKRGGAIGTNKKRLTTVPICADLNVMGVIAGRLLHPGYLMTYFSMVDLGKLDNGSSVPQINNKDISPLRICLPPMELQEKFTTIIKQSDKTKLTIQQSLDRLETLKNALMQQYFE